MKQEEKSEKQIGNQTDPVLQYMRKIQDDSKNLFGIRIPRGDRLGVSSDPS